MGFSIELHVDSGIDAAVRELRTNLLSAGLSGFELDYEFNPHVTLGYFDETPTKAVLDQIHALSSQLERIRFTLSHVGLFSGLTTSVVFLGLTPSPALLDAHRLVQEQLEHLGLPSQYHYRVGNLVPHVTLGEKIPNSEIEQVLETIKALPIVTLPCSGIFERLVVATDRPISVNPLSEPRAPSVDIGRGIQRN